MMSCGHSGVLANLYTGQNSRGSVASVGWLTVKTSYKKGRGLAFKVIKGKQIIKLLQHNKAMKNHVFCA